MACSSVTIAISHAVAEKSTDARAQSEENTHRDTQS
jgi:hypothetical protein